MSKPSKSIVILAGVSSIFFSIVMIAMTLIMYALETPVETCLLFGLLTMVPLLVATACFAPKYRWFTLRILGALGFLACSGTLIQNVLARLNGEETSGGRLGLLIVALVGTAVMAWKGKWPESDNSDSSVSKEAATEGS